MSTDRYLLPLMHAGQAQKEMTFNEALTLIDMGFHPAVETMGLNAPPTNPAAGQSWLVGSAPTGAWEGRAGSMAGWTEGGWRFLSPQPGMLAWVKDQGWWARYDETGWIGGEIPGQAVKIEGIQVVGGRRPAIADPSGGSAIDSEARTKLSEILSALRAHGLIAS